MNVRIAATAWERLRGLLMRPKNYLGDDGVLALVPCNGIHTIGMTYPIDVAFVGREGKVLKSELCVTPGRLLSCRHAIAVLERPSCSFGQTLAATDKEKRWFRVGDCVVLQGRE